MTEGSVEYVQHQTTLDSLVLSILQSFSFAILIFKMNSLYLIALCGIIFSWPANCSPFKRQTTSNFSLYAYGDDGAPGGSPLFYADGK